MSELFERDLCYRGFYHVERRTLPDGLVREVVIATDSVLGLVHIIDTDEIVLIEECRPATITVDNPQGLSQGPVAGRIDIDLTPEQLLIKESLEEAGITVSPKDVTWLNHGQPMYVCAGMTNERSYLAYVRVLSDQIADGDTYGVAHEGECTTRVRLSRREFLEQPVQLVQLLALQQWLENQPEPEENAHASTD